MKVISFEGERRMAVSERPKPTLQKPTDAVLRVTTSGISRQRSAYVRRPNAL